MPKYAILASIILLTAPAGAQSDDGSRTKKEFLEYAAGRLGTDDPKLLERLFDAVDRDHDGTVSATEFERRREALQLVRATPDEPDSPASKEALGHTSFLGRVFAALDSDQSGSVSREEFDKLFQAMQRSSAPATEVAPTTAAQPKPEGARSKREFIEYASSRLGDADEDFFERLFRAVDRDRDGWVSTEEFDQRMEALNRLRGDGDEGDDGGNRESRDRPAPPAVRDINDKEGDYDAAARRAVPRDRFEVLDSPNMSHARDAKLEGDEPVIGVVLNGEARAYPIAVMGRHELVNDVCATTPIAVSW